MSSGNDLVDDFLRELAADGGTHLIRKHPRGLSEDGRRRMCVIGHPISHSRSPLIHSSWMERLGIEGVYEAIDVAPSALGAFFASFVDSGFFGANVTIPHKTAALEMTVLEDALPARLRAINTVYVRNDAPYGANTDVAGFAAALRVAGIEKFPRGSRGVVIGAGGAARAVMSVLLEAGIEDLRVVSRSLVRGREALNSFPRASDDALWHPFEDLERILSEAAVAVNASPLGMKGAPPLEIPLDALPRESAAIDLVYVPVETPFLRRARERGHPVADGLDMLFAQAAESFRLWHGVLPPIDDDLRAMTVADINREIEGA